MEEFGMVVKLFLEQRDTFLMSHLGILIQCADIRRHFLVSIGKWSHGNIVRVDPSSILIYSCL